MTRHGTFARVFNNGRIATRCARKLGIDVLEDRTVPAVFTVTTASDDVDAYDGYLSLREAIAAANEYCDTDEIAFDIDGAGVHTIHPESALPAIEHPVLIDGFTQSDTWCSASVTFPL